MTNKINKDDLKKGCSHYIELNNKENPDEKIIFKFEVEKSYRVFKVGRFDLKDSSFVNQRFVERLSLYVDDDDNLEIDDLLNRCTKIICTAGNFVRLLSYQEGNQLEIDRLISIKNRLRCEADEDIQRIDKQIELINNEETTNEK